MIPTRGLTHIALAVHDPERAFRFYEWLLGVVRVYDSADFVQAQTPGSWDVLVFERDPANAGREGAVRHFGFRLLDPADVKRAIATATEEGATIVSHGEFCPGEPYVFLRDPDGNEVELWYELPTPVDPPAQ